MGDDLPTGYAPYLKWADRLDGATLISPVWSGYVHGQAEIDEMKALGIDRIHVHTSGHATVDELRKYVAAFPDSRIIPIHLEDRDSFQALSEVGTEKRLRVVGGLA